MRWLITLTFALPRLAGTSETSRVQVLPVGSGLLPECSWARASGPAWN